MATSYLIGQNKHSLQISNHDKMFSDAKCYVDSKNELSFCIHITEFKILTELVLVAFMLACTIHVCVYCYQ